MTLVVIRFLSHVLLISKVLSSQESPDVQIPFQVSGRGYVPSKLVLKEGSPPVEAMCTCQVIPIGDISQSLHGSELRDKESTLSTIIDDAKNGAPASSFDDSQQMISCPCSPNSVEIRSRYGPPLESLSQEEQATRTFIEDQFEKMMQFSPLFDVTLAPLLCTDGRNESQGIYYPGGDLGAILLFLNVISHHKRQSIPDDHVKAYLNAILTSPTVTNTYPDISYCTDIVAADYQGFAVNSTAPSLERKERILIHLQGAAGAGNFWWKSVLKRPKELGFSQDSRLPSKIVKAFHELVWEGAPNASIEILPNIETNNGPGNQKMIYIEIVDADNCLSQGETLAVEESPPRPLPKGVTERLWHSQASLSARMRYAGLILEAMNDIDPECTSMVDLSTLITHEYQSSAKIMNAITEANIEDLASSSGVRTWVLTAKLESRCT